VELASHRHPLAIFCDQVFFVYDPSSATSLLSSVGISTWTLDVNQTPQSAKRNVANLVAA